jgi:hypothetical protein
MTAAGPLPPVQEDFLNPAPTVGTFMMGSDSASDDEKPSPMVTIKAFKMQETEVTYKRYFTIMAINPQQIDGNSLGTGDDAMYLN